MVGEEKRSAEDQNFKREFLASAPRSVGEYDGFRSLAYLENSHCRLVSRRRNTYKSFEVLREALSGLKAQSAILDGEIVCLDSNGVSQFKELS